MDNKQWGKQLAADYKGKTGSTRNIRLPAPDQIEFDGGMSSVKVTMKSKAIVANLQSNAAAFEAWSLALRVWCGVEHVELRWQQPVASGSTASQLCHYQRFLYRAERFRSLFPEWFHLVPEQPENAKALGDGLFFLNSPGVRPNHQIQESTSCDAELRREAGLEKYLRAYGPFIEHFGLEKVDRQMPVGLFGRSVKQVNRIFTGAKSAIDLVGIGDGALWLFELKAGGNIPAGILSELIFYTSVMRDAIPGPSGPARFQFQPIKQPIKPGNESVVCATDVIGCRRIEAVLLGPQFHPLIGDPLVINTLNEATALHWNTSREQVPVAFRATLVTWSAVDGYRFEPALELVH